MKMESKEEIILLIAASLALLTFQGMFAFLALGLFFVWEDSKWPAFDSDNYDKKMMNGPLKPWNKGI